MSYDSTSQCKRGQFWDVAHKSCQDIGGRSAITSEWPALPKAARVLAESDPSGKALNQPGTKADAGKARPHLVLSEFSRALAAVVDIGTFGANKYTPRGWVEVPDGQARYADAAMRHQLKSWQGERLDTGPGGTGGLHKAQVIWNLLAELELELRGE